MINKKAKGGFGIILILILLIVGYYFFLMDNGVHNPFKTKSEVWSGGCSPNNASNIGIDYKYNEQSCTQELCTGSNGEWIDNNGLNICSCRGTCIWEPQAGGCDCLAYAN